jgi:hypothetical protein
MQNMSRILYRLTTLHQQKKLLCVQLNIYYFSSVQRCHEHNISIFNQRCTKMRSSDDSIQISVSPEPILSGKIPENLGSEN